MGPSSRTSRSIFSRRDNRLASLIPRALPRACRALNRAILRGANKHFDEIVVQPVVDLALKMPRELRIIEIAGVNGKHVGVNRHGRVLQVDEHFNHAVIFACGKSEQRMFVQFEVLLDSGEFSGVRHVATLMKRAAKRPVSTACSFSVAPWAYAAI